MNARIYNAKLGRFQHADPNMQACDKEALVFPGHKTMIRLLIASASAFLTLSCASHEIFPVPATVPIPDGWHDLSSSTIANSQCPQISGKYVEPPDRHSTPGSQFAHVSYPRLGYIAVMSFNLSETMMLDDSNSELVAGEFELIQKGENQFSLRDVNLKFELSEHLFERNQGDFECHNGLMYFPLISRYGADQQGSFNDQHQGILAIDQVGNLVLIRISGPYKKTMLKRSAIFEYDYMRYSRIKK